MTEEQKVQELLKPRYKVIGEYPFSQYYFKLNEIVELPEFDNRAHLALQEWFAIIQPSHKKELGSSETLLPLIMHESTFNLYPHLFRKLEWHEERDASEMPEYYKYSGTHGIYKSQFQANGGIIMLDFKPTETVPCRLSDCMPATPSDYHAYINQPA